MTATARCTGLLLLLISPTVAAAQQMGTSVAEAQAKALVAAYYERMDRVSRRPRDTTPCEGISLQDCFGGDPECLHPRQGIDTRAFLCTDPEFLSARQVLLDRLDSLRLVAPESGWIIGQTVYLAVKTDDVPRANAIADQCRAALWWCQALRGFARHHAAPGSGGPALDSALAGAPTETYAWVSPLDRPPPRSLPRESLSIPAPDRGLHCEWTDLSLVLMGAQGYLSERDGDGRIVSRNLREDSPERAALLTEYELVPCGENRAFEERFWWLADPFWSANGNERRDEHITRNIQRRLRDQILLRDTDNERGKAWTHPEMIALGPPNSWGSGFRCGGVGSRDCDRNALGYPPEFNPSPRRRSRFIAPPRPYVNGGYSFAPDAERFTNPIRTTQEDWAVIWGVAAESMITPDTWYNLEDYQSAVLWRDGRLLALAATGLPVIVPSMDTVRAALAMGRPADLHVETFPGSVGRTGVVRAEAEVEDAAWMMSVEIMGYGWRARARHGAPAPELQNGFGVSAPVLVDQRFEQDSVPLLDAMLPTTDMTERGSVGVYFEVYGAEDDEALRFSLTTARTEGPSLLGRVARFFRLSSGPSDPMTIDWTELTENSAPGWMPRYLEVDFGSLDDGSYEVTLSVARADGTEAISSRIIRIER